MEINNLNWDITTSNSNADTLKYTFAHIICSNATLLCIPVPTKLLYWCLMYTLRIIKHYEELPLIWIKRLVRLTWHGPVLSWNNECIAQYPLNNRWGEMCSVVCEFIFCMLYVCFFCTICNVCFMTLILNWKTLFCESCEKSNDKRCLLNCLHDCQTIMCRVNHINIHYLCISFLSFAGQARLYVLISVTNNVIYEMIRMDLSLFSMYTANFMLPLNPWVQI